MSDLVFERLRTLVLERLGGVAAGIAHRTDIVPIEQTEDGWLCLLANGHVAHMDSEGADKEPILASGRATALIGNLAVRFPIATWFVPRSTGAIPCPVCAGTGRVPGVPEDLSKRVVCRCGGLGWLPISDECSVRE